MKKVVNSILPISRSKRLGQQMLKSLKLDLNSIEEFYILLDNPHKTFKPGEEVCGQVILILKKNLSNVLITLSLIGLIKLIGSGSTFRSTKKTNLFNHTINLYGNSIPNPPHTPTPTQQQQSSNHDNMEIETNISNPGLTKGEHHFPFIVKLPKKDIYTSVTFEKGEIRYSLKASISDSYFLNNNSGSGSPIVSSPSNTSLNNNRFSNSPSSKTSLTRNNLLNLNNTNNTTTSDSSNTLSNDITNNIPDNNTLTSSSNTGNGTSNQRYSNDLNNSNNSNKSILTCEKYLSIIKPINLSLLPESQPKILVFRVPKKGLKKTISSTSTVNSQLSSYSQDFTIMTPISNNNNSPEDDSNNQSNSAGQNLTGSAAVSITSSTHSSSENDNSNNNNNNSNSNNNNEEAQKVVFASPLTDNNNESEIPNKLNFQQSSQSSSTSSSTRIANDIKLSVYTPSMGYLRGEIVPVKINVQHYKKFKSPTGIIVTLIRICRIDQGAEHAIQSFRKDLSQSIVPLFLSPNNKFQYEVTTSLKIPLDCFPTIVGSNMVSFQYYIEVIVNLSNSKAISNQNKAHLDSGMDDEDIYDVTSLNDTSSPSNTTNQSSSAQINTSNTPNNSTTPGVSTNNPNTSINSNNSSVLNINDSGIINDYSYNGGIYNDNEHSNNPNNITNNNNNELTFDHSSNSNNNSTLNSPNNGNSNNGNWVNNLDNSSNNRNNIFNVDKLKRAKHVLTLLNEIVIGTERKPISKLRRSNKHKTKNSNSHQHGIVSTSNSSTSTGPSSSTISMTQLPPLQVQQQVAPLPLQRQSFRLINKIEDNVNNSIDSSPSPINSIPNSPNVMNSPSNSNIIDNNNANVNQVLNLPSHFINIPNFDNNLSEKQKLKLREEALLPSEPVVETSDNTDTVNSNSLPDYIPLPVVHNTNDTNDINDTNNINNDSNNNNGEENSGGTNESNDNTNNSENTIRMIDILRSNNQEFINNNDFLPAYQEYSQKDS
ncbi:hypothetical protein BVG19_g5285 [[Candida] boidinii]|nr:hypothetical protein BVG19_g5285 [[Candida] boidinii]OWB53805.1 hypothetical protein B5S27_g5414 [[Candida] boidinii]